MLLLPLDVLRLPFARRADVDHQRRIPGCQFFRQHESTNPLCGPDQILPFRQCLHSVLEITLHVIKAYSSQAQSGFLLASRLGDDHNGPDAIEESAGPCGVLAA